jgi:3-oxoacyl-[acyl-carrier protein] reductase
MATFSLPGKVAVVTGASSGIGAAAAHALAAAGMKVVLAARREELLQSNAAEICEHGGEALVIPVDLRQPESAPDLVKGTLEKWGQLDLLINCAGVTYDEPLIKVSPFKLREEIDVDLTAVVACSQAALKPMLKQRSGHIINVASIAGLIGLPGSSIYSAAKFGVVGFSEGLGREVGRFGVHVSAFCPGFVSTDFGPRLRALKARQPGAQTLPGVMPVEYVAERLVWLAEHPRRRYLIPHSWTIMVWAARTFPWGADVIVSRFI